jgi:transcriptional regulator with XRE-family HTH domain
MARTSRGPDPCDVEIGKRVRALRLRRNMSQTALAGLLDITFQQLQKYERGSNRISAGRLQRIADVLDAPITFFFQGLEKQPGKPRPPGEFDFLQTDGAMRLMRAYARIKERDIRTGLLRLAETIAES